MNNILFLDHTPFIGGAELVLAKHIKHLDKSKYKPFVICSPDFPQLIQQYKDAGAKVFTITYPRYKTKNPLKLPKSIISIYKTAKKIKKIAKNINSDLIVTNTARAWLPGTLAARRLGTNLIWFIRDYTYPRALFRLLIPQADGVTFVSERLQKHYLTRCGCATLSRLTNSIGCCSCSGDKHRVIYVGTDMHKRIKKLGDGAIRKITTEFNLQENNIVIGFVGRLVEWKGAAVLLEAIRNLKTIKVLIIGSGTGQEGDIEEELRDFVKENSLEETVYLTGQRNDVPALLKVMDIFVHPSIEPEPFATTVVEAMQAGVAVIGNTIGGTPEIIEDGKNGLLVPPNNPEALAKALQRLIKDEELRTSLAKAGRNKAVSGYTEEIITNQVEELYEEVFNN